MDYRHTEDFARRMEIAGLRAQAMRNEELDALFAAVVRGIRRAVQAWRRRAERRREPGVPEA